MGHINFFNLMILLLLSSTGRGNGFDIESDDGMCDVDMNEDVFSGSIEDQLKANCLEDYEVSVTGGEMLHVPTIYCSLLPKLTQLEVKRSKAARFADSFKEGDCKSLEKLYLFDNWFTELPGATFQKMNRLKSLDFSNNALETLSSDAFTGLGNLTHLYLRNNHISQLPNDLFKPLASLEFVQLSENNLTILDLKLFSTNAKLYELQCKNCGLTSILPSTVEQLKKLDVSKNRISQLADDMFKSLPNLEYVELSRNSLETLDLNQLSTNTKIVQLRCNKCGVTKVLPSSSPLHLTRLELSKNRIEKIYPGTLAAFEKLCHLDLTDNRISQFPDDQFKFMSNLEYLSLSGNNFTTLDLNQFSKNAKLRELSCNNCGLTSILPSTQPLQLKLLRVMSNQLTNITALNGLKSLVWLLLSNNTDLMLENLDFSTFPKLIHLQLGRVSLYRRSNYQKLFPPSLKFLDISENNLRSINLDQLNHLKRLEVLDIEHNDLKSFDVDKVRLILPNLVILDMTNNRFSEEQFTKMEEFLGDEGIAPIQIDYSLDWTEFEGFHPSK